MSDTPQRIHLQGDTLGDAACRAGGAVSDLQERIKGDGSQGGGERKRQVGGLKGFNGSMATAVRS